VDEPLVEELGLFYHLRKVNVLTGDLFMIFGSICVIYYWSVLTAFIVNAYKRFFVVLAGIEISAYVRHFHGVQTRLIRIVRFSTCRLLHQIWYVIVFSLHLVLLLSNKGLKVVL
jgi:hypothetical protein